MNVTNKNSDDKALIELVLTLLAVITGTIAAIGAFLGASYEKQRVDLERKPALFLSCEPEFRILDVAEGARPPTHTALLTDGGARWIHFVSDGREDTPQPFASCALTNYGQLPVFNIRMRLTMHVNRQHDTSHVAESFLDVAGLSPSSTYSFALINATGKAITFAFEPSLMLIRVDTGTQSAVPLFLSEELVGLERRIEEPESLANAFGMPVESNDPPTVRIRKFRYTPTVVRVRTNEVITFANGDPEPHTVTAVGSAFDSGSIDPGATWVHRFTRPGTYWYKCSFHPYMRGRIVVSKTLPVQ